MSSPAVLVIFPKKAVPSFFLILRISPSRLKNRELRALRVNSGKENFKIFLLEFDL